jgi:hypothetical protein
MPFFEQNPLAQLAIAPEDADAVLDLRELADAAALAAVEELLSSPGNGRSYLIRFAAARNDGRETLFQPLGRRLLQARRDGILSRCLPAADGAAYFVAFASDG